MSRNEESRLDATLRTPFFDRTKGKGVDETPTSGRV